MNSLFDIVTSKETVASFGIDMSLWGEEEQAQLREKMLLAMKKNPQWEDEIIKEECKNQVENILFEWFQMNLARMVNKSNGWPSLGHAYNEFSKTTLKKFLKTLNKHQEYQDFCEEFYDDLRAMWNICSSGMEDEFERMKKEGLSNAQYREWLDEEMRKKKRKTLS